MSTRDPHTPGLRVNDGDEGVAREARGEHATLTSDQARARLAASVTAFANEFAEVVGGFFLSAGVSGEVGAAALERAAARVRSGEASLDVEEDEPWVQLTDAIALWWRDPDYVNEDGSPRPLPDTGPAPSLEALFERTVDRAVRPRARVLLRQRAALEQDGLWHYLEDQNVLRLGGEEGAHRLVSGIAGWMRTYVENQLLVEEPPHLRKFDAAAHVSNFPVAVMPELCAKLYKRVPPLLQEFDALMTSTAQRGDPGPMARVSIVTFMHTSAHRPCSAAGGETAATDPTDDRAPGGDRSAGPR